MKIVVGIFLVALGLFNIIFSKTLARQTYEYWSKIFPQTFWLKWNRIGIVLGGIFVITLGVLLLFGLIK
jgi:succinate dehydrogenase hydrophobic anchor subunit